MSQAGVLTILETYPNRWFTTIQLTNMLKISSVGTSVRQLRRHNLVKYKVKDKDTKIYYQHLETDEQ